MGFFGGIPPFMGGYGGFGGLGGYGGFPGYVGPDLYNMPHSHQEAEEIREKRSNFMQRFFITMGTLLGLGALVAAIRRPNIWYQAQQPRETAEKPRDTYVSSQQVQHQVAVHEPVQMKSVRINGYEYKIPEHQNPSTIKICKEHQKEVDAKKQKLRDFNHFLKKGRSLSRTLTNSSPLRRDPEMAAALREFQDHSTKMKDYAANLNPSPAFTKTYKKHIPGSAKYTETLQKMKTAIDKYMADHQISKDLLSWKPDPAEVKKFSWAKDAPHVRTLHELNLALVEYKSHLNTNVPIENSEFLPQKFHKELVEIIGRLPR